MQPGSPEWLAAKIDKVTADLDEMHNELQTFLGNMSWILSNPIPDRDSAITVLRKAIALKREEIAIFERGAGELEDTRRSLLAGEIVPAPEP